MSLRRANHEVTDQCCVTIEDHIHWFKDAVENLRVEAARLMMEQSRHPIDIVARQTGFGDRDRMRRAFLRAFGQPPLVMRRNARMEGGNLTAHAAINQ